MNVSVAQNILLRHLVNLAGGFGVSYEAGQEGRFFSSLRREGVLDQDLATLNRLLNGRSVKLEDYRIVVRDLTRLRDERVADGAIRRRFEGARDRFARCHDAAMAAPATSPTNSGISSRARPSSTSSTWPAATPWPPPPWGSKESSGRRFGRENGD